MSWIENWKNRHDREEDDARDPELAALLERARSLPREATPDRDLFAGIANRIRDPELDRSTQRPRAASGWAGLFPRPFAAAGLATALVAATVVATLWISTPPTIGELDDRQIQQIAQQLRERDGVGEVRASVERLLGEHRTQLPAEAIAAIEQNLQSIDRAIAEIHLTLEAHPGENALGVLLAEAYRREAALLERLEWWTRDFEEVQS